MKPTLVLNPVTDRTFAAFAAQELDSAGDIELYVHGSRHRDPESAQPTGLGQPQVLDLARSLVKTLCSRALPWRLM